MYTPCGSNNLDLFQPQGLGANFTLGTESAPVLPYKNKLLALTGVDMKSAAAGDVGDQHAVGMGHMLTARSYMVDPKLATAEGDKDYPVGFANGISVDQEIANAIGVNSRYKSLEFGVQTSVRYGNHPFSRMNYAAPGQPVSPEDSPLAAYNRLFGSVSTPPGMLDAGLARRRSVLDYVLKEFETVNASVPAADKVRLDQHLSMIREVERGLQAGGASGPVSCDQAAGITPIVDYNLHANFPAVGKQQADLLVLALACGLTRVASLQYSYARSLERLEWVSTQGCGLLPIIPTPTFERSCLVPPVARSTPGNLSISAALRTICCTSRSSMPWECRPRASEIRDLATVRCREFSSEPQICRRGHRRLTLERSSE